MIGLEELRKIREELIDEMESYQDFNPTTHFPLTLWGVDVEGLCQWAAMEADLYMQQTKEEFAKTGKPRKKLDVEDMLANVAFRAFLMGYQTKVVQEADGKSS